MQITLDHLKNISVVRQAKIWNDRIYITLHGTNDRAKADFTTKLWTRGDVLTIEGGNKGYHSDTFISARDDLISAIEALGGRVERK